MASGLWVDWFRSCQSFERYAIKLVTTSTLFILTLSKPAEKSLRNIETTSTHKYKPVSYFLVSRRGNLADNCPSSEMNKTHQDSYQI